MRERTITSTVNRKGFTYALTSFGNSFIEFSATSDKPVVDIGAAYGVATLPALLQGAKVIAVDISDDHLTSISNSVNDVLRNNLTALKGRFPDFNLPSESVSAVYMSQVLPFLRGEEIEAGMKKVYDWLVPGGKIFIVSFTPFISHVRSFIPEYLEKKSNGIRWAGYIDNLSAYCNDPHMFQNLPNNIHHVDADDLRWVLEKTGFHVEEARYFGQEEGDLPVGIAMDGRERVGVIASKPRKVDFPEAFTWRRISQVSCDEVPQKIWPWLSKPFVLSKALARVCSNFQVTISDERLSYLHADEIVSLKCFNMGYGYVRETYLGAPEDPLVYARVSLPYSVYLKNKLAFDTLGTRPIGEALLYNNGQVTRSEFEVKKVSMDDELMFDSLVHQSFFQAVIEKRANVPELWARRSTFIVSGEPVLITEVFLSNIPDYINN